MSLTWFEFDERAALDAAFAVEVAALLDKALQRRGAARLVVSGGKTPSGFFEQLSHIPINWGKVTVMLADDRWLPPEHVDSNQTLVRAHLLQNAAAAAQFEPFDTAATTADAGQPACNARLATLPMFDVVILGMGDDAHTASLFPGSAALAEGLSMSSNKQCVALTPLHAPYDRISMTLPRLLNTQSVFIHICGDTKKQLLQQALVCVQPLEMPIAAVLQQKQTSIGVYWAP